MITVAELKPKVFREAANIVNRGWCDRSWAEDKKGNEVKFSDDNACRFCSISSIYRATLNLIVERDDVSKEVMEGAVNGCIEDMFDYIRVKNAQGKTDIDSKIDTISHWNQEVTQEKVVNKLLQLSIA